MKTKVRKLPYKEVMALPAERPIKTRRASRLLRALINVICAGELKKLNFRCDSHGMEQLRKRPCLYLMNHSSFLDLKIAERVIPCRFNIVATYDAFVGKRGLLSALGCIPTTKFVTDVKLVRQMKYCFDKLHISVLMYPEAGYSIDGTTTVLPFGLGKCIKLFGVPVVMITTYGDFLYDPLYNGLQQRNVDVFTTMECMLTAEQIAGMSVEEINAEVAKRFDFDNFRHQQQSGTVVAESFRADNLERVLYKCPCCGSEGRMEGSGDKLICHECHKVYQLTELGYMRAADNVTEIEHIPDWYAWERECVRKEIESGTYRLDTDVSIYVVRGTKAVYDIGRGHLTHTIEGFHLTTPDGELNYVHPAKTSYSVIADFLWYELGDVIGFGDNEKQFYCMPADSLPVVKARLAAEEIYKILQQKAQL